MNSGNWVIYSTFGYFIIFTLAVFGFAIWRVRRSRVRAPVKFKLLRGPGETLRRKVASYDENLVFQLVGAAFAPPLVALSIFLGWVHWFKPTTNAQAYACIATSLAVFVVGFVFAFRWALNGFYRQRDQLLGYLGERAVAEELGPLERQGYRVFHDVPARAGDRAFNLDHVIVGPTGVFAVETKTRRKGRARPGFKDYEVIFDGQQLVWPWGEDTHGLTQAESEARWLSEWLHKRTGLAIEVKPILALPGWMVREQKLGSVRVLNAKNVPAAVIGRNIRVLSSEQIDLISRLLDVECRDVEN